MIEILLSTLLAARIVLPCPDLDKVLYVEATPRLPIAVLGRPDQSKLLDPETKLMSWACLDGERLAWVDVVFTRNDSVTRPWLVNHWRLR
jgi:hypothetical protein